MREPEAVGGGAGPGILTADLVARAIIAAARAYGDDPVRACEAKRGLPRRSLTPAAAGIARATGLSFSRVALVIGIREQNLWRAQGRDGFEAAATAAMRAASYAQWRPEARASVVGGEASDAVTPPPLPPSPRTPPELDEPVLPGPIAPGGCAPPVEVLPKPAVTLAARGRALPVIPDRPARPQVEAAPTAEAPKAHHLTPEDARHLLTIRAVTGGVGFPVARRP